MTYLPREDSFLLQKCIKDYAHGRILDMGTGSGILAVEAARFSDEVIAADIDSGAIKSCQEKIQKNGSPKIKFIVSDLFAKVYGKFDLIIFNPPYLPNHPDTKDIALDGGEKGYELAQRFLGQAVHYLTKDGKILLLISTLTNRKKIEATLIEKKCKFKIIKEQKMDFESLFVYLIEKEAL